MIIVKKEKVLKGEILMSIGYRKMGDYEIPNLQVKVKKEPLGKYSIMRLNYLKEHNNSLYQILMMKDQLTDHLIEIENTAQTRIELMITQMMEQEKVNEELKAKDQMKWVRLMNNIKNSAEEVVIRELIYN
ncbi:MAG: TnpV protein [Bacilli bacterium]